MAPDDDKISFKIVKIMKEKNNYSQTRLVRHGMES